MPVELRNAQRRIRVDVRRVKRVARKLLQGLQRERMVLSVLLTDDRQMAALHERWMGDSSPTDVLSWRTKVPFPGANKGTISGSAGFLVEPGTPGNGTAFGVLPEMVPLLGDIAISVETAARRSPRDPMKEIENYLIHGVLHLIGHDHVRSAERSAMNVEARRLRRLLTAPEES